MRNAVKDTRPDRDTFPPHASSRAHARPRQKKDNRRDVPVQRATGAWLGCSPSRAYARDRPPELPVVVVKHQVSDPKREHVLQAVGCPVLHTRRRRRRIHGAAL